MRKQKLVSWLLFTCGLSLLYAQDFEGVLTLEFSEVKIDSFLRERELAFFGADYVERKSKSTVEYIIKSEKLLGYQTDKYNDLLYRYFQDDKHSFLITASGNRINYSSIPMENMAHLKRTRKSRETKMISGYRCREYEYLTDDGRTQIIGWIAEDIEFNKSVQYSGFFRQIFLPDGLAFEKRMIYGEVEHLWKVTSIDMKKISDEVFAAP